MSVDCLQSREICASQNVEHKPVVALTEDLSWDAPHIEIAIARMKAGRFEEAQTWLEETCQQWEEPSSTLKYNLAQARLFQRDFQGALPLFEEVAEKSPDQVAAIEYQAYCHMMLGNRRKAETFALRAMRLGIGHTYDILHPNETA